MKKRILSSLLTLGMALCFVLPGFPVFASDVDGTELDTAYNTAAQELDDNYGYTEYDLGAVCVSEGNNAGTRFRLWSPTASGVKINVYTKGTNDEAGATRVGTFALEKLNQDGKWTGVWEVRLIGNWSKYYYTYSVTDADTGRTAEIADPYSRQLSRDGKRSYTVDFDYYEAKPDGWDNDSHVYFDSVKARSVYRLDVAGYTQSSGTDIRNKGKFLGLTETGTTYTDNENNLSTGLDHIKQLGVTAVELDGVFDAANAFAVNVQCATDQWNAVSELRQLIKALHSEGLTVIIKLPVGFVEVNNGAFDDAVPNYYFRLNEAGEKLDGSGFGNELASERFMYRNWLITTLLGWVNEYHVDGISLEQSALIDTDTLSAAIAAVKAVDDRIAVFADGECKAVNSHPSTVCTGETFRRATSANSTYLPSTLIYEERSDRSLYAEICDDLGVSSDLRNETAVKKAKLAAGLLALSKGVFYIDAGDEMCAAELDESTFAWENISTYFDAFSYYRGLLQLRAAFPEFASDGLPFNRGNVLSASDSENRLVTSSDANSWKVVSVSYNATDERATKFADCAFRDWDIVVSSGFAGIDSHDKLPESESNNVVVDAYSLNVAVDSQSFASAGFSSGMETLTIEFIDEETKEKIAPDMVLTGKSGEGLILPNGGEPRLDNGYELHKVSSYENGKFGEVTKVTCEYGYIFDGIKEGGEYCSPVEFKLKGIENVIGVQLDGVTLTPVDGTYTLTGSGECTVTVETQNGSHIIKVKLRGEHAYQFITENGTYYKKCSACGHTTSPQAIPSVEITAPERVCAGQDCVVTVGTLPSGVTVDGGFYEFEFMGSEIDVNEENGVWSGTVSHEWYQPGADTFDIGIGFKTADGYFFTVKKTVKVLAQHTGGTATCTEKAKCEVCGESYGELDANNHTGKAEWIKGSQRHEKKYTCCGTVIVASEAHEWSDGVCSECGYACTHTDGDKNHVCDYCGKTISDHTGGKATCKDKAVCEVCGKAYGEIDANNHTDLKHVDAKAATKDAEGNIEYWYCEGCNKYYSDAAATKEIKKADTITAKLPDDPKTPQTGDSSNMVLWIALLCVSGGALTGVMVLNKRKKHSVK